MFHVARVLLVTLAAALVLCAVPAAAQNLITNGDFATDVTGWLLVGPGTFTFDGAFDANGNPASGSGHLQNTSPAAFGEVSARQCLVVTGGTSYDFGVRVYIDSAATTTEGRASLVVNFYDGAGCTGAVVSSVATPDVLWTQTNTWIQSERLAITAPPAAVSVMVRLFTINNLGSGTLDVHFDNAIFGPAGILPVELERFSVE